MVKGDKDYVIVSFDDALDPGVTITGTPTVAEVTTSALTLSSKSVSAGISISNATYTLNGYLLTKVSGFTAYEFRENDSFTISSGTGATAATYLVGGKISDHQISLLSNPGDGADGSTNITGTLNCGTMILGEVCPVGRAVLFFVDTSSATGGTTYRIRITAVTTANSSTGVCIRDVLLKVLSVGGT